MVHVDLNHRLGTLIKRNSLVLETRICRKNGKESHVKIREHDKLPRICSSINSNRSTIRWNLYLLVNACAF